MRQTLLALFATFAAEPTTDLVRGYVLGLGDLSQDQIKEAVFRAIRECHHLPKPSELRRLAGEDNNPETLAIAAWSDVLKAVPLGPWKHVAFQDVLINGTIRLLGGWPTFIERFSSADDEKWLRQDFIKAYKSLAGRGAGGELCLPLAGLSEKEVVNGSLQAPIPYRIGCSRIVGKAIAAGGGERNAGALE